MIERSSHLFQILRGINTLDVNSTSSCACQKFRVWEKVYYVHTHAFVFVHARNDEYRTLVNARILQFSFKPLMRYIRHQSVIVIGAHMHIALAFRSGFCTPFRRRCQSVRQPLPHLLVNGE